MASGVRRQAASRLLGIGLAVTALDYSVYTVDGGHRAVIFDRFRGVLDGTIGDGVHFRVPFLQKPYLFDTRHRPHTLTYTSATKDLRPVHVTLLVIARPKDNGPTDEFSKKLIPFIGKEVLNSVVLPSNTERAHVSALVSESLVKRARKFDMVIKDVFVTQLSYAKIEEVVVEMETERKRMEEEKKEVEEEWSKFLAEKEEEKRRRAVVPTLEEMEKRMWIFQQYNETTNNNRCFCGFCCPPHPQPGSGDICFHLGRSIVTTIWRRLSE